MISEKQTSLQFDQSHTSKRNNQGLLGSSIRCEFKVLHLEYPLDLTVLFKQYVSCKLSFNEVFVIFVDFVLK